MKVVLDTDVMVAAIRSQNGASRYLLKSALNRKLTIAVSVPLMIEYEAIMTREDHLNAAGLSAEDVAVLLDAVAAVAEPVELFFHWRPMLKDANDDMVLETAVNGGVEGLVTFNKKDFAPVKQRFSIAVMSPALAVQKQRKDERQSDEKK